MLRGISTSTSRVLPTLHKLLQGCSLQNFPAGKSAATIRTSVALSPNILSRSGSSATRCTIFPIRSLVHAARSPFSYSAPPRPSPPDCDMSSRASCTPSQSSGPPRSHAGTTAPPPYSLPSPATSSDPCCTIAAPPATAWWPGQSAYRASSPSSGIPPTSLAALSTLFPAPSAHFLFHPLSPVPERSIRPSRNLSHSPRSHTDSRYSRSTRSNTPCFPIARTPLPRSPAPVSSPAISPSASTSDESSGPEPDLRTVTAATVLPALAAAYRQESDLPSCLRSPPAQSCPSGSTGAPSASTTIRQSPAAPPASPLPWQ